MTLPALIQPAPGSYEAWKAQAHAEDRQLTADKKAFGRTMRQGWLKYQQLHPGASRREFIAEFNGGVYSGTFYAALYSGEAQHAGFNDPTLRYGQTTQAGLALSDGDTVADIRARLAAGEPIRRPVRAITTLQIPAALAPELRAIRDQVSESDKMNGPEATARILQSYGGAPLLIRDSLRHMDATGLNIVPALVEIVDTRRDYRAALKQQPCVTCGTTRDIELHHQKVEADDRNRTHTYLVPLCTRCHIARPGDDTAIHARKFEDIKQDAEFWRRAFIAQATAAELTRPTKEDV